MSKRDSGILGRGRIARRIIRAMTEREVFLLLGHQNPDEDCVASLVAVALLLKKFNKDAQIYLAGAVHENVAYLLEIAQYNGITLLGPGDKSSGRGFDTIIVCDTAKPSMIEASDTIRSLLRAREIPVIEIDHHLGADSDYIGDPAYRMVAEASSTCELVGFLAVRLRRRRDLLVRYQISDPFSRNFVLAVLTGIIADSKMGQFLKSRREKRFYARFSRMFNTLLAKTTVRRSNLSDKEEVFAALQRQTTKERRCFDFFMEHRVSEAKLSYVSLSPEAVTGLQEAGFDNDTVVTTARSVADILAEESGFVGMVVYSDPPEISDLVQFRVRRSRRYKKYDLRNLLSVMGVKDGGGHEGAVGFRFAKKDVEDFESCVRDVAGTISRELPEN